MSIEEKIGEDDNQALKNHANKDRSKKEDHPHNKPKKFQKNHRPQRDYSSLRCYTCDEKGHLVRDCPQNKRYTRTNKKKRDYAHAVEDDEPASKRTRDDSSSDEQNDLISGLTGIVTHGNHDWLVDSGASKRMTRFKYFLKTRVTS